MVDICMSLQFSGGPSPSARGRGGGEAVLFCLPCRYNVCPPGPHTPHTGSTGRYMAKHSNTWLHTAICGYQ